MPQSAPGVDGGGGSRAGEPVQQLVSAGRSPKSRRRAQILVMQYV
jgi:hypothetical protein